MFTLMVIVNSYSIITGIICIICLAFLFFESAFGICLGCLFYPLFHKQKAQRCPGEVCGRKLRQDIQKISGTQVMVVIAFVVIVIVGTRLFNEQYSKQPYDLLENIRASATHN